MYVYIYIYKHPPTHVYIDINTYVVHAYLSKSLR